MDLKLVVLIKQVPDITKVRFDLEKGRVDRSSAEAEINPFDLNALEAAVQIKEKLKAMKAEVVVWHAENLANVLNLSNVGYSGSPTMVSKIVVPKEKEGKIFNNVNEC